LEFINIKDINSFGIGEIWKHGFVHSNKTFVDKLMKYCISKMNE